jgi:hypothetical protein
MSYLRCLCLCIVVFNTYCVVFLFCFSSSMLPVSLDCPFVIAPSLFSNVYILYISLIGDKSTKYFAVVN